MDNDETKCILPVVKLTEIVSGTDIKVVESEALDGNINEYELEVLIKVMKNKNPDRVLEIGTFDGRTAINMAINTKPSAKILTLNLPPDSEDQPSLPLYHENTVNIDGTPKIRSDSKYINKVETGHRYKGKAGSEKITQLWGDSATFDFEPYYETTDVVFIDGAHSYEYVKNDTLHALKLINKRGCILWHDYVETWQGVPKALNEFYQNDCRFKKMIQIEGTKLAYLPR